MLLGKRQRPPMKRTTSMTEFTLDLCPAAGGATTTAAAVAHPSTADPSNPFKGGGNDQRFLSAVISPRTHRQSADFTETGNFLRACSLCNRRLVPGRDIYMYRGDSAFCSLECRQQQMNQDERKEKCSVASKKDSGSAAAGSQVATKGETVAAV